MEKIVRLLKDNPALQALNEGKTDIVVDQNEALLYASAFLSLPRNMIIIKKNQEEANRLYEQMQPLLAPNACLLFCVDESMRIEALASSPELVSERMFSMYHLTKPDVHVLITHSHALVRYIPSPAVFKQYCLEIEIGMHMDIYALQEYAIRAGYQNTSRVDTPFYFSKRGGIIDIYTAQYEYPIRIEFFDDEIEDLRLYDPASQKTIDHIKEVTIIPASDILYEDTEVPALQQELQHIYDKQTIDPLYQATLQAKLQEDILHLQEHDTSYYMYRYMGMFSGRSSIMDYMEDSQVIVCYREDIYNEYYRYIQESDRYIQELETMGKLLHGLPLYYPLETILPTKSTTIKHFASKDTDCIFHARPLLLHKENEVLLIQQMQEYMNTCDIIMCLHDGHQMQLMIDVLERHGLAFTLIGTTNQIYKGINIYVGNLSGGTELVDEKIVIITEKELFENKRPQRIKYLKFKDAKVLRDYQELHIGDYIVHDSHGIGQYLGIKTLQVNGCQKDYLYVGYAGDDVLYIPVEQFKLIRKYASASDKPPKVHKLGSSQWIKTKQKIQSKINDIADKLIDIYASRMQNKGFAFPPDTELQQQFDDAFGYELTADQQKSIDEIKKDMEKPQPMDRLLCGDVGFGKTEVALRAAFKAVLGNKQVAFLCPTTILSMQHFRTMEERFKGFPVRVALLNRFTSLKVKREILQDVADKKIDILVGTHRILSKDVRFSDIGLLCVDEEQRFGVSQKEKIKEYRKTIDVLTLSATPIPRTLQMSLMGIRGLSQIETPPKNRLPVQTYVIEKNELLIKQIIEKEIARGGQVFYLYNRTQEINTVAYRLSLQIPQAKIAVGHGKMSKEELEDVMLRFMNQEFNLLVCTTIIETGIDIPNANTIIVENADRFGLSQLYQIKGRVGRGNRSSYAYLLYNAKKEMPAEAAKRLQAIKEFAQLGSGYKIAMRDLSIRGSGDILGGKQAGFIDTIGFDMYMRILQDTIKQKKGVQTKEESDIVSVNMNVNGYIPKNYVSSDIEKLELYQKLETAKTMEAVEKLVMEFEDYYGRLPDEVITLMDKRKFDILCNTPWIDLAEDISNNLQITFSHVYTERVDGNDLFKTINQAFENATFRNFKRKIMVVIPKDKDWLHRVNRMLETLFKKIG